MNVRNLLSISLVTAIAIATAACQSNESLSSDTSQFDPSNAAGGDVAMNAPANDPANYNAAGDVGGGMNQYDARNSAQDGLQQVAIVDQTGAGQPMQAASLAIPAGWQAQGGVDWDRSVPCVSNQMRYQWQATSPDGSEAFTIMPGLTWQVQGTENQMNPCRAMPFRTAEDFLKAVVQQQRPGAQILQYRPRQMPAPSRPPNAQGSARVEGGDLLIAYQSNGKDMREVLSASVMFTELQGNIMGGAASVTTFRAPSGRLDFSLAEKINASLKADPQWMAAITKIGTRLVDGYGARQSNDITRWHNGRMAAINARGAGDRAAIRASASRDIANIYSQINANNSATDDVIHRQNLEAIGGYNTYSDPTGGNNVRADIQYDRVLRNGDGSYVGTNDPYYNPAGSAELERQ
ncbi:MAG: hypothetical protein ABI451_06470 [Dokdonella sp.]